MHNWLIVTNSIPVQYPLLTHRTPDRNSQKVVLKTRKDTVVLFEQCPLQYFLLIFLSWILKYCFTILVIHYQISCSIDHICSNESSPEDLKPSTENVQRHLTSTKINGIKQVWCESKRMETDMLINREVRDQTLWYIEEMKEHQEREKARVFQLNSSDISNLWSWCTWWRRRITCTTRLKNREAVQNISCEMIIAWYDVTVRLLPLYKTTCIMIDPAQILFKSMTDWWKCTSFTVLWVKRVPEVLDILSQLQILCKAFQYFQNILAVITHYINIFYRFKNWKAHWENKKGF